MAEATESKWEGKVSAKVRGTAEQVWPFVEDFCGVDKWLPLVGTSNKVEGEYGKPGLIRHCQAPQSDGDQKETNWAQENWAQEKLLSIDSIQRSITYEVIKSNIGFHSYVGTWKVIPIDGDDHYGCEVERSFVSGPIDGLRKEDFLGFIDLGIQGTAERMNKALESTN